MVERLKSWESPRKRGRNDKGKGGTARARQLKKREKLLRKKLKQNQSIQGKKSNKSQEGEIIPPLFFCACRDEIFIGHLFVLKPISKFSGCA